MIFNVVNVEYFESIIITECRERVLKELSEIKENVLSVEEYISVTYDDCGDAFFDYLETIDGVIMLEFVSTAK